MKNKILDIVETLFSAHDDIEKLLKQNIISIALSLLGDCQNAIISVGEIIQNSEGESHHVVELIENYCKELFDFYNALLEGKEYDVTCKVINKSLTTIKEGIEKDIKGTIEVVFMPYKASMWDSLESIWKAACEDPECDAYVVPIPYYDRNPDYSFGDLHYDGNGFPDYVPITDYREYNEFKRRPDVIYIHNPYDDCNYVTSVHPIYYSKELKKSTDCLVYIPYGMLASLDKKKNIVPVAAKHVDFYIMQADTQYDSFVSNGVPKEKLLIMGSPKIDFALNELKNVEVSETWKNKIQTKKTFLINVSISYFLRCSDWESYIKNILKLIKDNEDCIFIWRPHPLLESTIKSMRPGFMNLYNYYVDFIINQHNVIKDQNCTSFMALKAADGMISDYSSLAYSFLAAGKPIFYTEGYEEMKFERIVCLDVFTPSYFLNDGFKAQEFIEMIKRGEDYKKEERSKVLNTGFKNMDGTCGEKIYKNIKDRINM